MGNEEITMAAQSGQTGAVGRVDDLHIIIREIISQLDGSMHHFEDMLNVEHNLTGKDRRRLFGSGVRNNGFIDKAFDIACDNTSFLPRNFNSDRLRDSMVKLEDLRQLMFTLQQYSQVVHNCYLQQTDLCYREALRIYGIFQGQTKNKVTGAEPLYEALRSFFRRRKRHDDESGEAELERDFKRFVSDGGLKE